ncbi:MAG: IscA/HesB family protein [Proteobacteria bacterium]|nr:adhesin [Desulfobulbaceae bacterium]MBU4151534.1 IscA/HesB family protein [Pseudomonadota bacterium]MDP2104606.1 IscA/HesB family protein [Desulfobulbaceae bacterium]
MLDVTEMAGQKLKQYLEENKIESAVRVALMNGCGGPSLGLALDEAKATDAIADQDGVRVIIDNELLCQCGAVRVDFAEGSGCGCKSGFSVTASVPLPSTGGGCGGSCSSGSCGS